MKALLPAVQRHKKPQTVGKSGGDIRGRATSAVNAAETIGTGGLTRPKPNSSGGASPLKKRQKAEKPGATGWENRREKLTWNEPSPRKIAFQSKFRRITNALRGLVPGRFITCRGRFLISCRLKLKRGLVVVSTDLHAVSGTGSMLSCVKRSA